MMISSLILADLGVVAIPAEQTCRLDYSAPDGDVTACVPITKQPASDHPFLKNHKIQMKPNYYPEEFFDDNKVSSTKSGKERHKYPSVMTSHEHDITYVNVDKNYRAKDTTNVWEPKINKRNEFIFSQIWLNSLFGQYLISIEDGWQVYSDVNMIFFLMSCIMICVCFTTS
ncbi:unnamed protein product [Brassica rapa]|uniref:Neprosin PEP catalytic domain-containing protein n=1 Tax=Brassica campestris TaxID=3711 RepID=A0A8D9GYV2_BRACM|nr:unnamed protein product [Brassica rapa]